MEAKSLSEELQRNQFKNQEKQIKEQERFIERFRAKASKAKVVQSRIKALERVERINDVNDPAATININFNFNTQPGKTIAELDVKLKKYKDLEIFNNTRVKIDRGDKIALIGANGKGKSTLLRMIDGSEPFEGTNEPGYNVVKAFYAQHQLESLNLENDMLQEMRDCAPDQSDTTLRTLLGAFLFTGDDVFKKVRVLSGGEKSRVALAKTILTKANFMLLDEPTNHLDIQSVNILIQVLQKFKGSYLIVSHDRFFLAEVANKIWYIENKQLKEYPGTYAEYEEWQERKRIEAAIKPVKEKEIVKPVVQAKVKENGVQKQADKDKKKQHHKLGTTVKSLELKIEELKKEKEQLITAMSEVAIYSDVEKNKKLQNQFSMLELELAKIQSEWEQAFSQMIELEG